MSEGILATYEKIVDASGVAPRLEALLPIGVRPRQLSVRTLLVGILLALSDGRAAHLSRVHRRPARAGRDRAPAPRRRGRVAATVRIF